MSPEDPQRALAEYIRDPDHAPAPAGIEARRLTVYRELFFNNLQSMLGGNFPVIHRILSTAAAGEHWSPLIRDFYREHRSGTPLFTELPREFLRYLHHRAEEGRGDPPWLPELAHYEWVELALQISENVADAPPVPSAAVQPAAIQPAARGSAALESAAPEPEIPAHARWNGQTLRLSPLAWPFAYRWPVHQLAPDHQPAAPPVEPTCLLLQRDADGAVQFQQLSALTFALLDRIEQAPGLHARRLLEQLAVETGATCATAFIEQGGAMLQQLCDTGTVIATPAGVTPARAT
ncbi:MAG: putative DNA-binding domain-containing protein [Lysobacter sp.]